MRKRKDEPKRVELSQEEMLSLQERIAKRQLSDKDYELLPTNSNVCRLAAN